MNRNNFVKIFKYRYPYAAVGNLVYGKYMSIFVTVLLDITVFGGGVPNLLVGKLVFRIYTYLHFKLGGIKLKG